MSRFDWNDWVKKAHQNHSIVKYAAKVNLQVALDLVGYHPKGDNQKYEIAVVRKPGDDFASIEMEVDYVWGDGLPKVASVLKLLKKPDGNGDFFLEDDSVLQRSQKEFGDKKWTITKWQVRKVMDDLDNTPVNEERIFWTGVDPVTGEGIETVTSYLWPPYDD